MPSDTGISHIHGTGQVASDYDTGPHTPAPKRRPISTPGQSGDSRLTGLTPQRLEGATQRKPTVTGGRGPILRNALPANKAETMRSHVYNEDTGYTADSEAAGNGGHQQMRPMRTRKNRLPANHQGKTTPTANFAGEDIADVFAGTPGSAGTRNQAASMRPSSPSQGASSSTNASTPQAPSPHRASSEASLPQAQTSLAVPQQTHEPQQTQPPLTPATPDPHAQPQPMQGPHAGVGPQGPHAFQPPPGTVGQQYGMQAPPMTMGDRVRRIFGMQPVNGPTGPFGPMGPNGNFGAYGQGSSMMNYAQPMIGMVSSVANIAISMLSAMLNIAENIAQKTEQLSRKN
ncbi:hypothetical protein [Robbsia andropogonis]|nr:hypothetical protein [Robbsia andropogonis]MCP1119740.1 hypothetical protein [Robbsia andropogonis]MCP1129723.1 hypothetical protein [Robbsia andropogonis]